MVFQLPYYVDGDVKITQSNAILRHLARKYDMGMYVYNEQGIKLWMFVDITLHFMTLMDKFVSEVSLVGLSIFPDKGQRI